MEHISCDLCGDDNAVPLFSATDRMFPGGELFQVVRCRTCGLEYVNPRPTFDNMKFYYPRAYSPFQRRAGISALLKEVVLAFQARAIGRAIAIPEAAVLDVGCARGELLRHIRDMFNFEVIGVDTDSESAEAASRALGVRCVSGTLRDAAFPGGTFDGVIVKHTLEHTHSPSELLREVNHVLKPGGKLFLWVPNKDGWAGRLFGQYWYGYDLPRHLYIFGKNSLSQMLDEAGYEIKHVRYSDVPNDWVRSMLFLVRSCQVPSFLRVMCGWRIVHLLLLCCFLVPSILAVLLHRGSRLMVVCRAKE